MRTVPSKRRWMEGCESSERVVLGIQEPLNKVEAMSQVTQCKAIKAPLPKLARAEGGKCVPMDAVKECQKLRGSDLY